MLPASKQSYSTCVVPTQVLRMPALLLGGIDTLDPRTPSEVGISHSISVCDAASSKEQLLPMCIRNQLKINVWDVPDPNLLRAGAARVHRFHPSGTGCGTGCACALRFGHLAQLLCGDGVCDGVTVPAATDGVPGCEKGTSPVLPKRGFRDQFKLFGGMGYQLDGGNAAFRLFKL